MRMENKQGHFAKLGCTLIETMTFIYNLQVDGCVCNKQQQAIGNIMKIHGAGL